ncbi:ankyrin repeat-containing protein ITN1-like [Mangifera indica]|uniref:ankyrin repeat-containing protein ITN1-like n=1 Tax=Mangifera indica TaxID=29780 RepID=UPI001CF979C2|nr:ankyrin repeat-containing protein ITN1-like [Mangifera indica]XP_044479359.1 ankyrin repeat-containing protein ITN1-like [Mangifera indica]XP_044479360.1 ankyrin repeat-containing protein ITN1-like [Mangifera indica]
MDSKTDLFEPYRAALQGDWEFLQHFYMKNDDNVDLLVSPLTAARDNAFHLAVFSKTKEPLQSLLNLSEKDPKVKYGFLEQNGYGNTPLHEAAANGNMEAVKALVDHYSKLPKEDINVNKTEDVRPGKVEKDQNKNELLEAVKHKAETPLFKAAAFGRIEVVKFLASKSLENIEQGLERKKVTKLKSVHYQNQRILPCATEGKTFVKKPDASILHVAITGHHFDTALFLLKKDESLATLKDVDGRTSLHLLATMPSAFKSEYRWGTWIHSVLYFWWLILLGKNCALAMRNMLEQKRKRELALKLVEKLIEKDSSWDETINKEVMIYEDQGIGIPIQAEGNYTTIPLLLATERGIVEIVKKILGVYPPLVEHENDLNQNILHVAIKHRHYEIFNIVKNMKIPMARLVRKVDRNGYTILHHAAYMEEKTTKIIQPGGPVYRLQEEMEWYRRVKEIMPSHYADLRDMEHGKTCEELFKMKHDGLLKQAQDWIKETSQSCSAVAVLVATLVFAAAYTVPGGSNEKGYPVFLNSTPFLVFIIMDCIALACSLTSVAMFLSILITPYTYYEFHHNIPRKLTTGFCLLYISLVTTMITFVATLVLIIRLEKAHQITTLIYTAAFLPVSVFALVNSHLYAVFEKTFLLPAYEKTLLKLYHRLSKSWCVTKPSQPKKQAAGQGSIADQAAPENPIAYRATSERQSIV